MKKTLTALLAAATMAAALAGSATEASAQRRGGAVAAGVLGGLFAGAIIGGAIASQPRGYVVYPAEAQPVYGPGCYWARMPVYDGYGNVVGYRGRPVQVCP
jgi:hypothetical protein